MSDCERCETAGACFCGDCGRRYDPELVNYCRHMRNAPRLCQHCINLCEECTRHTRRHEYDVHYDSEQEEPDDNEAASGSENEDPNVER